MTIEDTPARGKLAAALAKAQSQYEPHKKSKTAKIKMKSGGEYSYKYADLSDMIDATRKALSVNALAVSQLIQMGTLETRLMHESGEELRASAALPDDVSAQEFGSALTYLRRYSLGAILGIASEDDDDGGAAQDAGARILGNKTPPSPQIDSVPVISADQVTRFWVIVREANWHTDDVRDYLKASHNIESTRKIPISLYETIVSFIKNNPPKEVL